MQTAVHSHPEPVLYSLRDVKPVHRHAPDERPRWSFLVSLMIGEASFSTRCNLSVTDPALRQAQRYSSRGETGVRFLRALMGTAFHFHTVITYNDIMTRNSLANVLCLLPFQQ